MKTHASTRHLTLLGLSLGLSACISLPFGKGDERPPPVMYSLHPSDSAAMEIATEAAGRIVVVAPAPELAPGLDAERIAIQFEDGRVDYYADAQWSARLDTLIHDVFLERAQRKLAGTIVGKPGLVPAANYRLVLKVTDFGPVYQTSPDMPPRLKVGLSLTVIELPQDVVRAQFIVEKTGIASENRLGVITTELKVLLHSVLDATLGKAAAYIREPQSIVRSNSAAINQSVQR